MSSILFYPERERAHLISHAALCSIDMEKITRAAADDLIEQLIRGTGPPQCRSDKSREEFVHGSLEVWKRYVGLVGELAVVSSLPGAEWLSFRDWTNSIDVLHKGCKIDVKTASFAAYKGLRLATVKPDITYALTLYYGAGLCELIGFVNGELIIRHGQRWYREDRDEWLIPAWAVRQPPLPLPGRPVNFDFNRLDDLWLMQQKTSLEIQNYPEGQLLLAEQLEFGFQGQELVESLIVK